MCFVNISFYAFFVPRDVVAFGGNQHAGNQYIGLNDNTDQSFYYKKQGFSKTMNILRLLVKKKIYTGVKHLLKISYMKRKLHV